MDKKIEEAREEFNSIVEYIVNEALGVQIHKVEDGIYRRLLRLGRILLELFVLATGTGEVGDALKTEDGLVFRRVRDLGCKYLAIFGEITIMRAHYAHEGREGLFPLDARLNLPARKYSYLLQDWMASKAVGSSYEQAAAWVRKHFDLKLAHRPIQRVSRDCTEVVDEFMDSLEPPATETEGACLVHAVDCKGIRMRPQDRNPDAVKTEDKPGEKRMACAAQTYSVAPHIRSNEGIAAGFFGPRRSKTPGQKQPRRPEPRNRRTFVSLKSKKSEIFERSSRLAKSRIHEGTEEKLTLMDGEKALWKLSGEFLPDWPECLDLPHAVSRLRTVGELHYGAGQAANDYGREAVLLLLEGRVDDVIEDFETALEDGTLSASKAKELKSKALGYFRNNRDRMAYDQHLAKGLPIATGLIESECNSLIKVRMEGAGMYWTVDGAEAILKLRGVFLDELWDEFWRIFSVFLAVSV
jgi:hypothetical protein